MKQKNQNTESFSLLETILTLAILTIIFSFSIPKLNFFNQILLKNEVDKIFSTFSFLQQKAIASNKKQELIFDNKNQSYQYINKKIYIERINNNLKFGTLKNSLGPPSKPTKKLSRCITFKKLKDPSKFKVTFFSDGKISPGSVFIVDKQKKLMSAVTCPISQVSCIRKYRYKNKTWICLNDKKRPFFKKGR